MYFQKHPSYTGNLNSNRLETVKTCFYTVETAWRTAKAEMRTGGSRRDDAHT